MNQNHHSIRDSYCGIHNDLDVHDGSFLNNCDTVLHSDPHNRDEDTVSADAVLAGMVLTGSLAEYKVSGNDFPDNDNELTRILSPAIHELD